MTSGPDASRSSGSGPIDLIFTAAATFFFSGLFPVAPGTVGSIAACGAFVGASALQVDLLVALPIAIVVACVICVALGPWYPKRFGKGDPSAVVIDECAGQWIALSPLVFLEHDAVLIVVGFAAFRLFDITKILGVKRAEKFPGGWGVLLDDVLAGVYAGGIVWGVTFFS